MKDIVLSIGSGKLIEIDGGKVFFYLTKDYLIRISFDQDNGIVREYVDREYRNNWNVFDVDYFDVFNVKPYSIDLLDENSKEDILGFLMEVVL